MSQYHSRTATHVPSVAMAIAVTLFTSGVLSAQTRDDGMQVLTGSSAFGDWRQDKPGVKRLLTPHDLPAISTPTYGKAEIVAMPAGAKPAVPPGFSVELVTSGLVNPRASRVAPNGDLFVADSMSGTVRVVPHSGGERQANSRRGLCQWAPPALRHRLLSPRTEPRMDLCR